MTIGARIKRKRNKNVHVHYNDTTTVRYRFFAQYIIHVELVVNDNPRHHNVWRRNDFRRNNNIVLSYNVLNIDRVNGRLSTS